MNSPTPNHYDPENASQLVQSSANAYLLPGGEGGRRPDEGERIIQSPTTDTRAVLTELCTPHSPLSTDLVLAFRGTADLRNWLTDLDWPKIPLYWAAGKVHRGFNTALESVAEQLDAAIHPEDPRRIWVTGHSLGGALAMLFALRLKIRRGREVAGVYTFGQPRLGNIPFSLGYDDALKARTFRVVHAEDIVPRVPWLLGSYRHAGHEVFYRASPLLLPGGEGGRRPDEGEPWQLNPPWWAKGSSDLFGLWSEWRWAGRVALFNDHHVSRYVEMLTGVAASRQSAADFGSSPRAGYGGCLPTAATQARSQTD